MAPANGIPDIPIGVGVVGADESVQQVLYVVDSFGNLTEVLVKVDKANASVADSNKKLIASQQAVVKSTEEQANAFDALFNANGKLITSNGEVSASQDEVVASTEREIQANHDLLVQKQTLADWNDKNIAKQTELAAAQSASSVIHSSSYNTLTRLKGLGTPEILKAATWSAFAIGGIAYEAIKQYTDFNKEIMQSVTQAGRPLSSLPFLTQTGLSVAKSTGTALGDVANMIYRVSSATASWHNGLGATNTQLAAMTRQVANLNVLGGVGSGAPTEQSARVLGALMNANLAGVGHNALSAAAFINAATGAGDIKQAELVSAFGRGLLPIAAAHGMSAASAGTFVDLLTTMGTPGSTAGQYAKTAINLLASPSAQGAKALAMVGIQPGELDALLKQKNGLVAVGEYLHQALGQFNPSAFNIKYKGATGAAGATALLQNWGVGDIPKQVIAAWAKGNLQDMTAKQLGTKESGATWLSTLENLIITKAFGGSKSAGTIDALVNNIGTAAGIYSSITRRMNAKAYNQDVQLAMNTPGQQFARMKESLMVDLVSIGKALTPAATTIGKVLVDIIGALTKFKIVLVPLVSMMALVIGAAVVSKVSGALLGGRALLGGLYKGTDRMWGRVFKGREDSALYGKLTGGGRYYKSEATTLMNKAEKEAAEQTLYFGDVQKTAAKATIEFTEAMVQGRMGIAGGSGLGGIKRAEGAVGEAESVGQGLKRTEFVGQDLNKVYRDAGKFDRNLLNKVGGDSAKYNEAIMMRQSRAVQNAHFANMQGEQANLVSKYENGWASHAEAQVASSATGDVEKGFLGRILSKLGGGGVGGVVESAGSKFGLGAMTDMLGGFLGGPMGMAAMAMLMPIAMPYIGKAISGIGSFFGGLFGGSSAKTIAAYKPKIVSGPINPNSIKAKILTAQAELGSLNKKISSGQSLTDAEWRKYNTLSNNISGWKSQEKQDANAWAFALGSGNAATIAKYTGQDSAIQNILRKRGVHNLVAGSKNQLELLNKLSPEERKNVTDILNGKMPSSFYATGTASERIDAWRQRKASEITATLLGQLKANRNFLLSNPKIDPAYYNLHQVSTLQKFQQESGRRASYLLGTDYSRNLKPGQANARYATFATAALRTGAEAAADLALAKSGKLGKNASQALAEVAAELKKRSADYEKAAQKVKSENKLTNADAKNIADAVVAGTKQANSELGLTQNGMANAFASVLGPNGLAGAIAKIEKQIIANG